MGNLSEEGRELIINAPVIACGLSIKKVVFPATMFKRFAKVCTYWFSFGLKKGNLSVFSLHSRPCCLVCKALLLGMNLRSSRTQFWWDSALEQSSHTWRKLFLPVCRPLPRPSLLHYLQISSSQVSWLESLFWPIDEVFPLLAPA